MFQRFAWIYVTLKQNNKNDPFSRFFTRAKKFFENGQKGKIFTRAKKYFENGQKGKLTKFPIYRNRSPPNKAVDTRSSNL